jgi:two-component system, NtrC family, nitrogen regulation sensor histidine kinase NtrY
MSLRSQLVTLALATLGALLTFHLLQRQLVGVLPGAGVAPELVAALERSQADLKALALADPASRARYHERFEAVQALANRLRIVDHNRAEIAARQQTLVLGAGAVALAAFGGALLVAARRDARRLQRVGSALAELAAGGRDIRLSDLRGDHIGIVARMIERTSDAMARDRQRLATLRHLAAWQEAARRQAHELRTPLTVARLEIGRAEERLAAGPPAPELARSLAEVRAEIQRVDRLVQRFASFAKLPAPDLRRLDLREIVEDFVSGFADAWPGLELERRAPEGAHPVCVDRAMLRQVLVNLCDNSARSLAGRSGTVTFTLTPADPSPWRVLEVADDGPGIAAELRARVFEPYVTTAAPGEGMGLGLAISRKIMLDHGGDLELASSQSGATFRLLLPREASCAG